MIILPSRKPIPFSLDSCLGEDRPGKSGQNNVHKEITPSPMRLIKSVKIVTAGVACTRKLLNTYGESIYFILLIYRLLVKGFGILKKPALKAK